MFPFDKFVDAAAAGPAFDDKVALEPFDLQTDCMPPGRGADKKCILPNSGEGFSTYQRISTMPDLVEQATWRNRFQDYLIWRSEKVCQRYKATLIATQFGTNFALNTVTTGTAGVAAIAVPPASGILAAIAAISNGTRGHFNEDFYQRYIAPALISKIDSTRSDLLTKIMKKRGITSGDTRSTVSIQVAAASPPTNISVVNDKAQRGIVLMQDYTLEEALGDVDRYNQLCSAAKAAGALVGDKTQFDDTATGVASRLADLRNQLAANTTTMETLKKSPTSPDNTAAITKLGEANADISKQIVLLQQLLLTAPAGR